MLSVIHRAAGLGFVSMLACAVANPASAQLKSQKVLSYEAAKIIATTAIEACQAKGFRVSVTVVDRNGDTVAQIRGDDASPHTMENSRRKAYTANTFRVSSAVFAKRVADGEAGPRQQATLPGIIAIAGALPIKAGEDVIGAAGVSGSPAGNDEVCVQAGLDKAKDLLK
jgi:uncharacterized protein GlcG (DUF336 family)